MHYLRKIVTIASLATTAFMLSSSAFAQESLGALQTIRMTDHVYMISEDGNTSLVVIGDKGKGVLITDTGSTRRARLVKAAIAKLTNEPVTKVVLSIEHTDHVGGSEVFENAQIIAQSAVKSVWMVDPTGQVPRKVDVYFDTEYDIDMGATRVELKHFGWSYGHANTVVYLPKESIVLLTDLFGGGKALPDPAITQAANPVGIHKVLQIVSKWKPKYLVTGHSTDTDPEQMYENARFYKDLYDAVSARLKPLLGHRWKEDAAVNALPKTLTLPAYKNWEGYKEFLPGDVYRMAYAFAYGG